MKRFFKVMLLLAMMTGEIYAAGLGSLAHYFVSESGVAEVLVSKGIVGDMADTVSHYVNDSLKSLTVGKNIPSAGELEKIIKELGTVDRRDEAIKAQLLTLLAKDQKNLSKDDLVKAVNNLIYLSHRYGKRGSTVLACSECVNTALHKEGFRFTMEVVSDVNVQKAMKEIVPDNPRDMKRFISNKFDDLGFGDYSKVPSSLVGPEEEESLAVFLAMAEAGSAKQRKLVDAIASISKNGSGEVQLVSRENPHKLWKLFTNDMSDEVLDGWIDVLERTAKEGDGEASKKRAFYKVLKDRAGDDPVLNEQVNMLKVKKCFFQ